MTSMLLLVGLLCPDMPAAPFADTPMLLALDARFAPNPHFKPSLLSTRAVRVIRHIKVEEARRRARRKSSQTPMMTR